MRRYMGTLAASAILAWGCKKNDHEEDKRPVAEVATAPASIRELSRTVEGFGSVVAASSSVLNVSLPRASVITRLLVVPGQSVAKGQVLFESSTDTLGKLSFQQAEVAAKAASDELRRVENLLANQLATASQLAQAKKADADAQAVLKSEKALGNGEAAQAFKSPFDGIVATISVSPGDRLPANAPILQLNGGRAAQIQVGIEPADAPLIKSGMNVQVRSALDDSKTALGSVKTISNAVDAQSQLVSLWIDVPANLFMIGTKVFADIIVENAAVLSVPRNALIHADEGNRVFVVRNGHAIVVPVKEGLKSTEFIGIEGDIKEGEHVLVAGQATLEDGAAVVESKP